jgi:acyl-CoA synthetase (NDP forming)
VLEQAASRGVRGAVVFALGFGEADEAGRQLQEGLVRVARDANMAVIGPNCQGLINFVKPVPLCLDAVAPYQPGRVGLMAQSGSVITALINNRRGVRWSHAVSSGNEAVVDAADILRYYVDSPDVAAVCAFLEVIRRPAEFFRQCDRAYAAGKPVIVCKAGRTVAAQAAITSHSGALAPPDRLVDALLRRHRVIRADSLDELLETAIAVQSPVPPGGPGVAVISASGGQIELVHDSVAGTGLAMPAFSAGTRAALTEILPAFLAPGNPLDWWGTAEPDSSLPRILQAVAEDENIDIVVQVADFTAGPTGARMRAARPLSAARRLRPLRPELFVVLDGVGGAPAAADTESALDDGIVVLSGFRTGLRALGHLVTYHVSQDQGALLPPGPAPGLPDGALASLRAATDALELLDACGFSVARSGIVRTAGEAVAVGEELGYPLVAKIADPGVAHKSDTGGVVLGLRTPGELSDAVGRLLRSGSARVLVQEQVADGTEMYLGLQSDPDLGTFVLAGLGGIWAELIDDVQVRPAGLSWSEAEEMIRELKGYRRLTGARGQQPVRLDVVTEAIMRLDAVARAMGADLAALDLNPVIIRGDRAIVVDAFMLRTGDAERTAGTVRR